MKPTHFLPAVVIALFVVSLMPHTVQAAEKRQRAPFTAHGLVLNFSGGLSGQLVQDEGTSPDPGPGVSLSLLYTVFPWLGAGISATSGFLTLPSSGGGNIDITLMTFNVEGRAWFRLAHGLYGGGIVQLGYVRQQMSMAGGASIYSDGIHAGLGLEVMKEVYPRIFVGITGFYQLPRWNEECVDMGTPIGVRCSTPSMHGWYGGVSVSWFLPL
ncbi:hypothetical protein KKF84_03230 [Myxococcota bacterium]|nr:hypothetical protein [Myxococcota bacterium]